MVFLSAMLYTYTETTNDKWYAFVEQESLKYDTCKSMQDAIWSRWKSEGKFAKRQAPEIAVMYKNFLSTTDLMYTLVNQQKIANNIVIAPHDSNKFIGLKPGVDFMDFCVKKGILFPERYNKARFFKIQFPTKKIVVTKFSFLRMSHVSKSLFCKSKN